MTKKEKKYWGEVAKHLLEIIKPYTQEEGFRVLLDLGQHTPLDVAIKRRGMGVLYWNPEDDTYRNYHYEEISSEEREGKYKNAIILLDTKAIIERDPISAQQRLSKIYLQDRNKGKYRQLYSFGGKM